jgi:hypothetical protein
MAWIRVQDDFINLDNVERVNISERGEIIRFEFYGSGGHLIRAYELDKQRGKLCEIPSCSKDSLRKEEGVADSVVKCRLRSAPEGLT